MENTEARRVIAFINASWPSKPLDDATAAVWGAKLLPYAYSDIMDVLDSMIETSKWRPSLAEIIGPLRGGAPSASEAFARVLEQIDQHPHDVTALESEVVRRLGGWSTLGLWNREKIHFHRREFVEVYDTMLTTSIGRDLVQLEAASRRALPKGAA